MKSLAIYRNINLTNAQRELYILICNKITDEDRLTFSEAKHIYLNYAHRYMKDGIPHRYNYWIPTGTPNEYTSRLEPMTEEEIQWATSQWLMQNIGRLVLKGYLTVLPTIELNKLPMEGNEKN